MVRPFRLVLFFACAAGQASLALVGACGKSPGGPGGTGPTVDRLEIVGPASIEPGTSARYTAVLHFPDGSTQPATNVLWSAGPSALLRVDALGVASAQWPYRGDATLQAEVQGPAKGSVRGTREILILPDGTFRLVGYVMEADDPSVPVWKARLEAWVDGDSSEEPATFATTGPDGRYKLYGVPRDSTFRILREGYVTATERVHLDSHGTRTFQLALERPRLSIGGTYTMTVESDGRWCGTPPLADELRRRSYEAVVAQHGADVTITLTSPQFILSAAGQGNRFAGQVTPTGVTFRMVGFADPYYSNYPSHPDIAERLADGTALVLTGTAEFTPTAAGWGGRLSGGLLHQYRGPSFPYMTSVGYCQAERITLTPR